MRNTKSQERTATGGRSITSDGKPRRSAAGKVVLAAIVHRHNYLDRLDWAESGQLNESASCEGERPNSLADCPAKRKAKFPLLEASGKDSQPSKKDKSGGCKFGRFFSKKKQTTLIDSAHHSELEGDGRKLDAQNAKNAQANGGAATRGGNQKDGYADDDKLLTSNDKHKAARVGGKRPNGITNEQVIEFKFDLIVECNRLNGQQKCDSVADRLKPEQLAKATDSTAANCKLMDNVDELLKSFVLDSADLCIMSSGKQPDSGSDVGELKQTSSAASKEACKTRDQFDYLCQLAAHSLARSFGLLQQSSEPAGCRQTNLAAAESTNHQIGGDKVIKENYYSIEISATLFLNERARSKRAAAALIGGIQSDEGDTDGEERLPPTQAAGSPTPGSFLIVDLLLDAPRRQFSCSASSLSVSTSDSGELATSTDNELSGVFGPCGQPSAGKASPNLSALDCPNLETALAVLEVIKNKLRCLERDRDKEGFASSNKLLLVSLKLKRGFNGGLFNNRMCLIDFDQSFVELHPIFESIFNGQALAHLRRHRFHLSALEQSLLGSLKSAQTNGQDTGTLKKQHHQVASHDKLIQAEWLLYKQLSSALIRTLLIVHVRKPASQTSARSQEARVALDHERRLMRENLALLEFARSIQRASATRLRRRKRHLKSHLVSSNVSVTSNLSMNSNLAHRELIGSSLFRFGQAPLNQDECCLSAKHRGLLVGERKTSLDAANLAIARRHHRHRRLDEAAYQQERSRPATEHRNQLSVQHRPRAGRKHSDFTESSSLSTSSGSQTRRVRSTKSSRTASNTIGQHNRFDESPNLSGSNNFSDSDSVTSANLNSCSSSSFNRLMGTSQRLAQRSRHRRDIELKWMTKQSSRASQQSSCQRKALIEQIELAVRPSPTTSRRSSSTSRAIPSPQRLESSVIQIDCEPVSAATSYQDVRRQCFGDRREGYDESMMIERTAEGQIDYSAEQLFEGVNLDNVSDVCSLVAEPPKQLRLEEFLSKLNCSMIAPKTAAQSSQQSSLVGGLQAGDERFEPLDGRINNAGTSTPVGIRSSAIQFTNGLHSDFQNPVRLISHNNIGNNSLSVNDSIQVDEDDEDCKSHSSILEHLSSLALESNSKLSSRQQSRQTYQQMDSVAICKQPQQPDREIDLNLNLILQSPVDGSLMLELGQEGSYPPLNTLDGVHQQHNANNNNRLATNEGRLQKLLNNSVRMRKANSRVAVKDPNSIGHRLRALSISCQTGSSAHPSSASPSSGSSGTFISPDGSVCCSTSSSSNDTKLSDRKNESSPTTPTSRSDPRANPHTDLTRRVIT